MKVGGEARLGYIRIRHWERFAADVGLPPDEVLGVCRSVAAEVPDRLADVVATARSEGFGHPVAGRLLQVVTKQAEACTVGFEGDDQGPAVAETVHGGGVPGAGVDEHAGVGDR